MYLKSDSVRAKDNQFLNQNNCNNFKPFKIKSNNLIIE